MKNLWNDLEAKSFIGDDLATCVYTSCLLGAEEDLIMHGGGNTSVKSRVHDFFGREVDVLFVKGSGWDLKNIEKSGFSALRLEETKLLAELEELNDTEMTKQLRLNMLDQAAPLPSVEAIQHAIMPAKFVDHTHADAVLTLSNNPNGEAIIGDIYSDCLILPYVMPGFILSKQVYNEVKDFDINQYKGIILHRHGVFTYSNNAREAYENMIELVSRAESYISENGVVQHVESQSEVNLLDLARIRKSVSASRGSAQLAMLDQSDEAKSFASRDDIADIASRGPLTPDHVTRTKRIPVILDAKPDENVSEIQSFVNEYKAYFERNKVDGLIMLDPAPRAAVWSSNGTIAFGSTVKECNIITDIARHTRWTIQVGESLGGWKPLSEREIFDLEYWVLQQAKLANDEGKDNAHQGKIAIVTGAAGGIGCATCKVLAAEGAVVMGLDIDPNVKNILKKVGGTGMICDVTDDNQVHKIIDEVVAIYGGLDILVCNAGTFLSGESIEEMTNKIWDNTISINLTATCRIIKNAIPYLKFGVGASIIVIGSRNYAAPGAGASAYSVSKAGVTQLARVAALELAPDGIRVNVIHPDAVFDTKLWTKKALQKSAKRYNMTVDEYKNKNLLGVEVKSQKVGEMVSALASDLFYATTGAQIPIDGGNDRVI